MKFSGVTILQVVELSIFLLIFEWALQQCSATALPVIQETLKPPPHLILQVLKHTANMTTHCRELCKNKNS